MKASIFRSLHAHFDRVERMADAQLCHTGEDASDETAVVLRRCRFGWLTLTDGLIAVCLSVWVCDSAATVSSLLD